MLNVIKHFFTCIVQWERKREYGSVYISLSCPLSSQNVIHIPQTLLERGAKIRAQSQCIGVLGLGPIRGLETQ